MRAPQTMSRAILIAATMIVVGCPEDVDGGEGEGEEGEGEEGEGEEGEGEEGEGEGEEGEGEEGEGEGEGEGEAVDDLTWYRDVLPVAQQKCMQCHVAGGIGPFDMAVEQSVVDNAAGMGAEIEAGQMPPWLPSADCDGHTYVGDRSLSASERALFLTWVANGAPLGDPNDAPTEGPPPLGALPRVDVTTQPSAPYTPNPAGGDDDYHCFILDPGNAAGEFIVGYDIVPGQRSMVHHVLLYAVDEADAQARDDSEAGLGWTCFGGPDTGGGAREAAGTLGAWAPGSDATQYPVGTGIELLATDVIVMQVHYNFFSAPSPIPADTTQVLLMTEPNVADVAILAPLPNTEFVIEAGDPDASASQVFPTIGRTVWGVLPHMHNLGTSISLTSPQQGCLIDIPEWDFHWQQAYFFADGPVDFQNLTDTVELECHWNNADGTEDVEWGENTTDEMCLMYVYTTP